MKGRSLLLGIGFVLLTSTLLAVPGLTNYQGRLTDAAGQPITNPVDVTFTFWDAESGGAQLGGGFSDTDTVTPDADGIYSTLIGDDPTNLVPESIFSGDSVWLNVNVSGEDLSPRIHITSVGYAVKASKADTATTAAMASNSERLDSKHAGDFALAGHGHNLQDLSGVVTDAQVPNNISIDVATFSIQANTANYATTAGNATYAATAGSAATAVSATTAAGLSGTLNAPGDRIALGTNVWLEMGANGRLFITANGKQNALVFAEWVNPAGLSDYMGLGTMNAVYPQTAMDDNENAIIIWKQSDGSYQQIFKSEYRNGAWTHPSGLSDNISPDGQNADNALVVMDNNGNAIICWRQMDGSKYQTYKSEYRFGF